VGRIEPLNTKISGSQEILDSYGIGISFWFVVEWGGEGKREVKMAYTGFVVFDILQI
jgi:hypothetical protein